MGVGSDEHADICHLVLCARNTRKRAECGEKFATAEAIALRLGTPPLNALVYALNGHIVV